MLRTIRGGKMDAFPSSWNCPLCGSLIRKTSTRPDEKGILVFIECACEEFAAFKYVGLEEMQVEG